MGHDITSSSTTSYYYYYYYYSYYYYYFYSYCYYCYYCYYYYYYYYYLDLKIPQAYPAKGVGFMRHIELACGVWRHASPLQAAGGCLGAFPS